MKPETISAAVDQTAKRIFADIQFTKEPAGLYDPLRYMIAIGGKRLRPRLCLLAYALLKDATGGPTAETATAGCQSNGNPSPSETFPAEISEPAAALEVFHTFTLIHDDIMDKSPLRRGEPTVWKKWCEDTAILSGDVMLIDSYRRIAKAPAKVLDQVMDLFSTTAAQVCDGQQYDMEFEDIPEIPMSDYEMMIGLKTAVLIACSAKMGALIAGADSKTCDALYNYAYQLGMAFQIADDYLDVYGDSAVFGKPIGGDILNNKKSWLLVHALQKTTDKKALLSAMALPTGTPEKDAAKIEAVKAIYAAAKVGADAQAEIRRFTAAAMDFVKPLNLKAEQVESLEDFADKLVGRAK